MSPPKNLERPAQVGLSVFSIAGPMAGEYVKVSTNTQSRELLREANHTRYRKRVDNQHSGRLLVSCISPSLYSHTIEYPGNGKRQNQCLPKQKHWDRPASVWRKH
jgi:hypothetical protein